MNRKWMSILVFLTLVLTLVQITTAAPVLMKIDVTPSNITLNVSQNQIFNATALDQNNTPMPGIKINWTVSDSTVGNLSSLNSTTDVNGVANTAFDALSIGNITLNATSGDIFGTANIAVISPIKPTLWNIIAGGQTDDMAIQTMGFYPGVITINVGDTITWNLGGGEPHTVSFLSGNPSPPPGSPASLAPAGNSTYNGTGIVSSGILVPGNNYSLTFAKTGVFIYQCLIHPGMQGIVIVNPVGTAYPFTQNQYTNQGTNESNFDINFGNSMVANLSVTSSPGPDNTTIWNATIDVPLPENSNVILQPNISQIEGTKNMDIGNMAVETNISANSSLNVTSPGTIELLYGASNLSPNSVHTVEIDAGTCKTPGNTLFNLNNLVADSNGTAMNTTNITGPPWFAIPTVGWIINIKNANDSSVSCGEIIKHDAGYMRFTPPVLNITQGDQVIWTQANAINIHTVSFLDKNQSIPELLMPGFIINPLIANKSGNNSYNGTGFFNSGILEGGQRYNLTFTNNGTFNYTCLIHDELNMTGQVNVKPAPVITPTPPPTSAQVSGKVFNDVDNNGVLDQGEQGISGITVQISGFDKLSHTFKRLTTITDSDGNFAFTDKLQGTFVLKEQNPGMIHTTTSILFLSVSPDKNINVNFGDISIQDRNKAKERIGG